MLNDYVLEKILINKEVVDYSVSEQSRIIGIFESIIVEICKEDEYADVSKLLSK